MLINVLGHDSSVHGIVYLGGKGEDAFDTTSEKANGAIEPLYDDCLFEGLD